MGEDLISRIKALQDSKNVCSVIAAYFLSLSKDEIKGLRLKDVDAACHVSSPSVMRFCKECGFDGYSSFRYSLFQTKQREEENELFSEKEIAKQVNSYKNVVVSSVINTAALCTEERLQKITEYIYRAHDICIFAGGSSFFAAEDLQRKLIKVNKYTFAYNDDYWMRFSIINAKPGTLFIGITYSGETKSVIRNLNTARENGFKTVLFTSSKNNHFEEIYDGVMYIDSSEIRNRLVNTSSRIALLFSIDIIYYAYIRKYYPEYFQKYKELRV